MRNYKCTNYETMKKENRIELLKDVLAAGFALIATVFFLGMVM